MRILLNATALILFASSTYAQGSPLLEFLKKESEARVAIGGQSAWYWRAYLETPAVVTVNIVDVDKSPSVKASIDGSEERFWYRAKVSMTKVIFADRGAISNPRIAACLSGKEKGRELDILIPALGNDVPTLIVEAGKSYTLALEDNSMLPRFMIATSVVNDKEMRELLQIFKNRKTLEDAWRDAAVNHLEESTNE